MKKLANYSFFVVLMVAVLVTAALVTSCDGAIEKIFQVTEEDDFIPYDPPAGMGYIRIKLLDNSRATITPTMPTIASMFYIVTVTDDDDSDNLVYTTADIDSGNPVDSTDLAGKPIALMPGNYSVEIFAYQTAATTYPLGHGKKEGVAVSSAGGNTVTVSLSPTVNSGNGTFLYSVTLPSNINASGANTTATMTVTTFPADNATSITNINLKTSPNNTGSPVTLASGFYYLKIAMADANGVVQNRTVTNILHIYQNIQTSYAPPILAPLNKFQYEVTYDENGGDALPTAVYGPIAHGSLLIEYTDSPDAADLTHPTTGYEFDAWVRDATDLTTAAATKWNFVSSRLIGDITLYATWKNEQTVALTINWANPSLPTLSENSFTFYQDEYYNAAVTQKVTVSVSGLGDYSIVKWEDESGTNLGNSDLVLSNASSINYLSVGRHDFTLIITKTGDTRNLDFTLFVEETAGP